MILPEDAIGRGLGSARAGFGEDAAVGFARRLAASIWSKAAGIDWAMLLSDGAISVGALWALTLIACGCWFALG